MDRSRPAKLQTTTLWYHPTQQHGGKTYGSPRYEGRTPSYVVWNLLERYTRPGDLVLDPFCGGGTAADVARDMGRRPLGLDLAAARGDLVRADARRLPVRSGAADFVFMDPPYSDHIEYSEHPGCIGKLSAFEEGYFDAMAAVFDETRRVLADRRYVAVYVSDTFKKKRGFVGIGARLFALLAERFRPIDHVAVVRGNRKLERPRFHRVAAEENFFLRGFNHLLVFKREDADGAAR